MNFVSTNSGEYVGNILMWGICGKFVDMTNLKLASIKSGDYVGNILMWGIC